MQEEVEKANRREGHISEEQTGKKTRDKGKVGTEVL